MGRPVREKIKKIKLTGRQSSSASEVIRHTCAIQIRLLLLLLLLLLLNTTSNFSIAEKPVDMQRGR